MQFDLFDQKPIARQSDPATSKKAAAEVNIKLPAAQKKMLDAFAVPRTAREAASVCERIYGGERETYRKRKLELFRRGLIVRAGVRACQITGKVAEVFQARK